MYHLLLSSYKIKEIGENISVLTRFWETYAHDVWETLTILLTIKKPWKFNKAYVKFKKKAKSFFFLIFQTIFSKNVLEKRCKVYTYNVRYFACTFIRLDRFATQLRFLIMTLVLVYTKVDYFLDFQNVPFPSPFS